MTWNSAHCFVAAWMGGEFRGRMATFVCLAESLHCSPEPVTALGIGYTPRQNTKSKKEVYGVLLGYFGEGNGNPLQYSCPENTMASLWGH